MKIFFYAAPITCFLGLLPAYLSSFTEAPVQPFVVSGFVEESEGQVVYYPDKNLRRKFRIDKNDVEASFDLSSIKIGSKRFKYSFLRLHGPGRGSVKQLWNEQKPHRWVPFHGEVSGLTRWPLVDASGTHTKTDSQAVPVLRDRTEISEDAIDPKAFFVVAGMIVAENQMDALGSYFVLSMNSGETYRIPYTNLYDDDSVTLEAYEQGRFDVTRVKCHAVSENECPFSLVRLRVIGDDTDSDVEELKRYVQESPWTYCDSKSIDVSGVLRVPTYVSRSTSDARVDGRASFCSELTAEGSAVCEDGSFPVSGCGAMCAIAIDDMTDNAYALCALYGGLDHIDFYRCY